jgi:hypothetical protein
MLTKRRFDRGDVISYPLALRFRFDLNPFLNSPLNPPEGDFKIALQIDFELKRYIPLNILSSLREK